MMERREGVRTRPDGSSENNPGIWVPSSSELRHQAWCSVSLVQVHGFGRVVGPGLEVPEESLAKEPNSMPGDEA